jgi:hypothetical protein
MEIQAIAEGELDFGITRSPSLRTMLRSDGSSITKLFHHGAVGSIDDVLERYNEFPAALSQGAAFQQLDRRLKPNNRTQNLRMTEQEKEDVKAFLLTLTGEDVFTNPKWSSPFDEEGNLAILSIAHSPKILSQPVDASICEGTDTTISIEVDNVDEGRGEYIWVFQELSLSIKTSTNSIEIDSVLLNAGSFANQIKYHVIVENSFGADTSDIAQLNFITTTKISTQPQETIVNQGDNLALSVTADGENLSYQWQKNSVNIANATLDTFHQDNIQLDAAGNYRVIVEGDCGRDTSDVIAVMINPVSVMEWAGENGLQLQVFPNPITENASLKFTLPDASPVFATIFSAEGIEVGRLLNGDILNAGKHSLPIDGNYFPSGIYFAVIELPYGRFVKQFVIVR